MKSLWAYLAEEYEAYKLLKHRDIFHWLIYVNWFIVMFSSWNPNFRALVTWQVAFDKNLSLFFFKLLWMVDINLTQKYQSNFHMKAHNRNRELEKVGRNQVQIFHLQLQSSFL